MKTNKFNIDFGRFEVKNFKITFPFTIVMQTNNREIEEYVFANWKPLMYETTIHTPQNKLEQIRMEKYIQRNLSASDKELIHKFFYDRKWITTPINAKCTTIVFDDFDAKIWTNPEVPYLEIKGRITIDIEKLIPYYVQRNFIKFTRHNKFVKEEINMKFMTALPLMLTYMTSSTIQPIIVKYFERECKKQNSVITKKLISLTKIKKIHTFKKKFIFRDNTNMKLEINDMIKLLGAKATRSPLGLTAAGYIGYKVLQKRKQRKILRGFGRRL